MVALITSDSLVYTHIGCQIMPDVKSLTISGLGFDPVAQDTDHATGLASHPASPLRELSMNVLRSNDLHELSLYISGNASLRVLDLHNYRQENTIDSLVSMLSSFNAIRNAKYSASIKFDNAILGDAVMTSFQTGSRQLNL